MFKQFFATSALAFATTVCVAQQKVTIKVVDEKSSALKNATVTVGNTTKQTDLNGIVEFTLASSSAQKLTIKHLGFKEFSTTTHSSQTNYNIKLEVNTIQSDAVFVYGTRAKENSATTFKNLNKEDIKKNNLGQDIPYLLDQTPGVIIGSDAGAGIGYTTMRIRGSDNSRINVTLNGIPLNDAESMGSFFVNLPDFASNTESIQIQRGIGTSTNGAGAFGASLNFQTDALETNPYAELNNTFGSFNTWKNTIKAGTGLIYDTYAFNVRLSRIASDGFVNPSFSDMKSFYVDGGIYTDKHTLKATVFSGKEKTYQAWNGIPEDKLETDRRYNEFTYPEQTDNYWQTHSHLHYTYTINPQWTLNTALHYTRGKGYYEEFRENDKFENYGLDSIIIKDKDDNTASVIKRSDLVRRRWLDNHFYGVTYNVNYKPNNQLNLTLGGAANKYLGDHYGEVIWATYASNSKLGDKYYFNDATKTDVNVYLKTDYRLDKWLFNADLQVRSIHYEAQGNDNKVKNFTFEDDNLFFNPKVGTTYFISPNANVYASYAYAGKEPVRKDYVENPKNEFPKPEYMQDIEAGYRYSSAVFSLGANIYAMLYKDQLVPTGTLNDTGSALRINVPNSRRLGIELDGLWNISDQFSWAATAALSKNTIVDFVEMVPVLDDNWDAITEEPIAHGNTDIAMSPSTVISNNLTYKALPNLSFSLLSKYVSRMYLDNTSTEARSIDPYFVHHARAIYSFSAWGLKNVDLNLTVNNLFNAKYETAGYTWRQRMENSKAIEHYNYYYPQATTNFLLGLNIRF